MPKHCQFYRIESYGLSSPGKKSNIAQVIGEAIRLKSYCKHVENPQIPTTLYGPDPHGLTRLIRKEKRAHEKENRKLLPNAQLLVGAVASYPVKVDELDAMEFQLYKRWKKLVLNFFKLEYGDQLYSVVLHEDEDYGHVHGLIKAKLIDGKYQLGNAHPGILADKGKAPQERKPAYKRAMKALQDRYWWYVGRLMGWARLSDKPSKRLTLKMAHVKKKKEQQQMEVLYGTERLAENYGLPKVRW